MAFRANYEFGSRMPRQTLIGDGQPAGKTRQLIADAPLLFQSGLRVPDSITFTPQFFRRFLENAGAEKFRSNEDACKRLAHSGFEQESAQMRQAILSSPVFSEQPLVVRLDDFAFGAGLSESFVIGTSKDKDQLIERVESAMVLALASSFHPDFIEFRKIRGAGAYESGILVMPLVGECFSSGANEYIAPAYSINYLGMNKANKAQMAISTGFAGANNRISSMQVISDEISPDYISILSNKDAINAVKVDYGLEFGVNCIPKSHKVIKDNAVQAFFTARMLDDSLKSFLDTVLPKVDKTDAQK